MTGSLGMVSSTVPVQWLLSGLAWRGPVWAQAGSFEQAMLAIRPNAPADAPSAAPAVTGAL